MKWEGFNYCDGCGNKLEGKDLEDIVEGEFIDYDNDLDLMG